MASRKSSLKDQKQLDSCAEGFEIERLNKPMGLVHPLFDFQSPFSRMSARAFYTETEGGGGWKKDELSISIFTY